MEAIKQPPNNIAEDPFSCIVQHCDAVSGHCEKEHMLSPIRLMYWIIGVNRFTPKIANLSEVMINLGMPPFSYSVVDLCAPFMGKRGRTDVKRY